MADERSNRVQMELELQLGKNMKVLQDTFQKMSDTLNALMDQGVDVTGPGARRGRDADDYVAGGLSGAQSQAGRGNLVLNPRGGFFDPVVADAPVARGSNASVARGIGGARYGFDRPNMNEYERGMFNLGQVGQGWLASTRYLSHMVQRVGQSEKAGLRGRMVENPETGQLEWAEDTNRAGRAVTKFGGRLGQAALIGTYGQAAWHTASGMVPMAQWIAPRQMNEMAQYGVNVGRSRGGWLGTPFGSPAWQTGYASRWDAWKRSRWNMDLNKNPLKGFGIVGSLMSNPNYSTAQAQEAQQITNAYGFSGEKQDVALDLMEQTAKRYGSGIGQETVMKLMDPALRFGTASGGEIQGSLAGLAAAADAANMNLEQFSEQAAAAAGQLSQAQGISGATALAKINSYSALTGQSPEQAAANLGNKRNMYLGAALSGKGLYETMKSGGGAEMNAMTGILGPLGDPAYWKQIRGTGSEAQAKEQLAWLYQADPSILGGMTPDEWINLLNRSGELGVSAGQMMESQSAIQREGLDEEGNVKDMGAIEAALRSGGMAEADVQGFLQAAESGKTDSAAVQRIIDEENFGEVEGDEVGRLALKLLGGKMEDAGGKAAQKTQVDIRVKPPYDKIFDAMVAGDDKAHSNSKKHLARAANTAGDITKFLPVVGGPASAGLKGLGGLLD